MSRIAQSATQLHVDRVQGVPNNLPHDLSSFIGRDQERAECARLLSRTRLLTLTGPGGAGKTRLAQRVATDVLDDYPDGVWLVELASLTDPALVAHAAAHAIGAHDSPGRPLPDMLVEAFRAGRSLLLLDNCEHLVVACAQLTEFLLRGCPRLRVLATSREPLGAAGEVTWLVPPLALPSGEDVLEADAVRLFGERATAARSDFVLTNANAESVAQICQRLDGMPLAIELAAARVRSSTPAEIAMRLDDRFRLLVGGSRSAPARQQTLRGALDWSYELLGVDERLLYQAISVFNGGFDVDALAAVCGGDLEGVLARLVDRSLVVAEPDDASGRTRFHLLETVRAYAWQHLVEDGQADRLRNQHSGWILRQAREADAAIHGPEQGRWLRWAEREHDNVRAALSWLIERGDTRSALGLVGSLWWSWSLHMRWGEALAVFDRVLALPDAETTSRARAAVLLGAGTIATMLGNLSGGRTHLAEAQAIGIALGDERIELQARGMRHIAQLFQGDQSSVQDEGMRLLARAREVGWAFGEIRGLETLASSAANGGQHARAAALLEEGVRISRREGDNWNLARCLEVLGDVERSRGDHARAARLYEESQAALTSIGLGPYPGAIHNLGYVALAEGDRRRASASFGQALALFRRIGDQRGAAECVIGLGCVMASGGDGVGAARLFAAGHSALAAMHSQLWPTNRADYARWLDVARSRATTLDFERAWTDGSGLSLEDAVAKAQSVISRSSVPRSSGLLTSREREVARLVARGLTNRQVAEALVVTEKTAANHVQRVLDKLDVHSRSQLAARASELGLI